MKPYKVLNLLSLFLQCFAILGSVLFQFFLFGNFRTESIVPAVFRTSVTFIFYIFWRIESLIFFSFFTLKPSGNRLHIQLGFFFRSQLRIINLLSWIKQCFTFTSFFFFYFLRQLLAYQFRNRPLSFPQFVSGGLCLIKWQKALSVPQYFPLYSC